MSNLFCIWDVIFDHIFRDCIKWVLRAVCENLNSHSFFQPELNFNRKSHGRVNTSCEDATPQPENSPARNLSAADRTNV